MTRARARAMSSRLMNMPRFQDKPTGILPINRNLCEHGYLSCEGNGRCRPRFLLMPMALDNFAEFDFSTVSFRTRLQLYRQTLCGLATVHARGVLHRSIKPGHLLVLCSNRDAPNAAICDFGASIDNPTSWSRDDAATPHTVAPEVWDALNNPYGPPADVWSLGYSWLWTMAPRDTRVPLWDKKAPGRWDYKQYNDPTNLIEGVVKPHRHEAIIAFVDEAVALTLDQARNRAGDGHEDSDGGDDGDLDRLGNDLASLLKSMLAWDPDARPTAEEALQSTAWADRSAGSGPARPREGAQARSGRSDDRGGSSRAMARPSATRIPASSSSSSSSSSAAAAAAAAAVTVVGPVARKRPASSSSTAVERPSTRRRLDGMGTVVEEPRLSERLAGGSTTVEEPLARGALASSTAAGEIPSAPRRQESISTVSRSSSQMDEPVARGIPAISTGVGEIPCAPRRQESISTASRSSSQMEEPVARGIPASSTATAGQTPATIRRQESISTLSRSSSQMDEAVMSFD